MTGIMLFFIVITSFNYFHEAVILILQVSEKVPAGDTFCLPSTRHLLQLPIHHLVHFLPDPNQPVTLLGISSSSCSKLHDRNLAVFISCLAHNKALCIHLLNKWVHRVTLGKRDQYGLYFTDQNIETQKD